MTDPITTPAQMREAAARLVDEKHYAYIAAKGRNPDDYVSEYSKVAAAIRALPVAEPEPQGNPVTLTYTNWRGETSERTIIPQSIWFGSTEWHPEPHWLLRAWDCEKQAERDFALKDFVQKPEPMAVNAVMCAAERDAQSRDAVDLTLFRQAIRAEALEEAAALPPYDCDGDPAGSFDHHVFVKRDAIRALMEKPE